MRHSREGDLDAIEPTLAQIRALAGLKEKKQGTFYRGSSGFLHFHIDGDDFYADVKLDGRSFERMRATTKAEQRALVSAIRKALQ
jgi:hypothetical protein